MVHWIRLNTLNTGSESLIPGWETKIPCALWHGQRKKQPKKKNNRCISLCRTRYPCLFILYLGVLD